MPSCVDLPEDNSAAQQCPYFSFTSLEDVVQTARESNFGSNNNRAAAASAASAASNVVSVGVDLSSLSRYQSLTNAEQHFFPSSLAFDLTCLLDGGIVTCANLGFQRKVCCYQLVTRLLPVVTTKHEPPFHRSTRLCSA